MGIYTLAVFVELVTFARYHRASLKLSTPFRNQLPARIVAR